MQAPQMFEPRLIAADTWLLESWLPVPGLGVLPANAFVIRAREPVLIDTGVAALRADFMDALARVLDPADIRWIWLTHTDADHVGSLAAVLDAAPEARVVTTFLGMAKLGLLGLPQDRVYLLNPGQRLSVGDRTLTALVPPTFDAPETTGLFDSRSRALFSADSFGAVVAARAETAAQIDARELREGMSLWTSVDAPWLMQIDRAHLARSLDRMRAWQAEHVFSSHLPPASGMNEALLQSLADAADAPAFMGPDQRALEAMMGSSLAEAA
jgi:flavorubredoxin